jgi:hypothetical protein
MKIYFHLNFLFKSVVNLFFYLNDRFRIDLRATFAFELLT